MGSAASTAYKLGQETSGSSTIGAGLGGVATAAKGAAAQRLRSAAAFDAAAARGEQAAWNAGNSAVSSGKGASAAESGAAPAAADAAPAWAQRLQGQQNARHRRQMAVHAIRDGDPIRAVVRGTSTNSDGRTPGIASPSAEAQAAAIRAAYANAGITNLNDTAYLECHGTGTQVSIQRRALMNCF